MNKKEIEQWIKSAEYITSEIERGVDKHEECVYKKDNNLYVISFCNSEVNEIWNDEGGFVRGEYMPVLVEKQIKTETITRTYQTNNYVNPENDSVLLSKTDIINEKRHHKI